MKKIFSILVLMLTVMVWQGCGPNKEKAAEEQAKADEAAKEAEKAKKEEYVAEKKARLAKARAELAERRSQAAAERARAALTYKDSNGKLVYNKAEVDPAYIGGNEEMEKYLTDHLQYPQSALDKEIEGTVYVDFVVDAKGKIRDVVATDYVSADVDDVLKQEAVRVVSTMPAWTPARQHGKPVDTWFTIPITFEMN